MSAVDVSPRRRRRRMFLGYEKGELPVKREPDEDIKDYAETTMNELLGWYGYEKVDSRDTQGLNLTHFASNSSGPTANSASPPSSAMEGSDASEDVASHQDDRASSTRPDSDSPGPEASSVASDEVARQHQQMVSALSSITKHPGAPDSPNLPPGCIVCAWCQKIGMKLFTLKTPNGCKAFCSELCFTQCRRASFKKNKICDWCKHVRHTVNYVDFQDGEQQLQFCSDKCLNQYKMNIFCKETQAHLQMHTHLKEAACKLAGSAVNLITPDLWLRDCKAQANGASLSPPREAVDVADDVMSDDNVSTVASPLPVVETSRPKSQSPPVKDKKANRHEYVRPAKDREKIMRKNASKQSKLENKAAHQAARHRERKVNDVHSENVSSDLPLQVSPPAFSRSAMTNGTTPHLSSPPMGSLARPPPHIPQMPPRHCPPVPSPLSMSIEHGRQQFLPPNLVPPPFHFLAQQQMEAIFRSQHGLDLRSKAPPLPMPPWVMPPFPQAPPPPPPPPQLPQCLSSGSPSLPHSTSPEKTLNHHHTNPKSNHPSKHKHKQPPASVNNAQVSPRVNNVPSAPSVPPSLLPPVTVMVPFPLVLPLPLPIPIPIPVPQNLFEKFQNAKQQKSSNRSNADNDKITKSKRRKTQDSMKQTPIKKRKVCHNSVKSGRSVNADDPALTEDRNSASFLRDTVNTSQAGKLESIYDRIFDDKISGAYFRNYSLPVLRNYPTDQSDPLYHIKMRDERNFREHRMDLNPLKITLSRKSNSANEPVLNVVDVSAVDLTDNTSQVVFDKPETRNEQSSISNEDSEVHLSRRTSPRTLDSPHSGKSDYNEKQTLRETVNSETYFRNDTSSITLDVSQTRKLDFSDERTLRESMNSEKYLRNETSPISLNSSQSRRFDHNDDRLSRERNSEAYFRNNISPISIDSSQIRRSDPVVDHTLTESRNSVTCLRNDSSVDDSETRMSDPVRVRTLRESKNCEAYSPIALDISQARTTDPKHEHEISETCSRVSVSSSPDPNDERTLRENTNSEACLSNDSSPIALDVSRSRRSEPIDERTSSENRNSGTSFNTSAYEFVENLSLCDTENFSMTYSNITQSMTRDSRKQNIDHESSRSSSPLSEADRSSGEDDRVIDSGENDIVIGNGDVDTYPRISFSTYSINSARSSPVTSLVPDAQIGLSHSASSAYSKSPLSSSLLVQDKRGDVSPIPSNFKRKCMRDKLSLMT